MYEIKNIKYTDNPKDKKTIIWENLQLFVLGLTILGQITVGAIFILGQGIWLVANLITLIRDFILQRPIADKVKNATLTAITCGLCVLWCLGIF